MFAKVVLSVVVLSAGVVGASAQNVCSRNATVAAGDTCDSVSNQYAVSTYQLAAVNSDINSDCTNLEIGQDLCLGWKGEDCSKVYVVLSGDTCDVISSKYGLSSGTLYANNPQINTTDCSNVYAGEVLCVDTIAYNYSLSASSGTTTMTLAIPSAVLTATATSSSVATTASSTATASAQPNAAYAVASDDSDDDDDCDDDDSDDNEDFCEDDDEDCDEEDQGDDDDLPYCDE